MTTIVVTGSTRGIGFGLAEEFLKGGANVVISGRTPESTTKALIQLSQTYPEERVIGIACEVSDAAQVQALWDGSVARFGKVDIWINNAGIDIRRDNYWELPLSDIHRIVDINLNGVMIASHIALNGMIAQGSGTLYNMEGFGSNGSKRSGMTSYGATKVALRYFTQSLQLEVKKLPISVGTLSPGIVITDLLMGDFNQNPAEFARVKGIFNILADKVETVTPWLAQKVLTNTSKTPAYAWLTTPKTLWRFVSSPFNKRNLFD